MVANGGLMPVSPQTLARSGNGHVLQRIAVGQPLPRSKDIILPPEQTRLALLSDWLTVPWRRGSFSPGDGRRRIGRRKLLGEWLQFGGDIAQAEVHHRPVPIGVLGLEHLERLLRLEIFERRVPGLAVFIESIRFLDQIINLDVLVIRAFTASGQERAQENGSEQDKMPFHRSHLSPRLEGLAMILAFAGRQ